MSRMVRRRSLTTAAAALAAGLVLPAAAHAVATYTVTPEWTVRRSRRPQSAATSSRRRPRRQRGHLQHLAGDPLRGGRMDRGGLTINGAAGVA